MHDIVLRGGRVMDPETGRDAVADVAIDVGWIAAIGAAAIGRFAPALLRAKGIVRFSAEPGPALLFQLVGRRVTLVPAPATPWPEPVRLVFIARRGACDLAELLTALEGCKHVLPTP